MYNNQCVTTTQQQRLLQLLLFSVFV